jgi:hypothetical protein
MSGDWGPVLFDNGALAAWLPAKSPCSSFFGLCREAVPFRLCSWLDPRRWPARDFWQPTVRAVRVWWLR